MFGKAVLNYDDAIADGILADEVKNRGWIIAYVEPAIAWPVRAQKVTYRGIEFFLVPHTNDAQSAVAVRANSGSDKELRERLTRFISVLSWINNGAYT